jgi:hypothetical protein
MKRHFVSASSLAIVLVLVGAGCSDPLPSNTRSVTSPATAQPLTQPEVTDSQDLQVDTLLGLQLPTEGLALLQDSSAVKQEGSMFYGQAYRLAPSLEQRDQLVGRVQILNLTDPFRNARTSLNDPMRLMLGCGAEDVNYGPACDFGKPVTSTMNGLTIGRYDITYYPSGNDSRGGSVSVTSTVWLVPAPKNTSAWLYVYPTDLKTGQASSSIEAWIKSLAPLP